jgi:hypothetical protein
MANLKKQEYYNSKRDERLKYQQEYYLRNKERISRKKEVDNLIDPEKREALYVYNQNYYLKNRDRLRENRRLKRAEGKAQRINVTPQILDAFQDIEN